MGVGFGCVGLAVVFESHVLPLSTSPPAAGRSHARGCGGVCCVLVWRVPRRGCALWRFRAIGVFEQGSLWVFMHKCCIHGHG